MRSTIALVSALILVGAGCSGQDSTDSPDLPNATSPPAPTAGDTPAPQATTDTNPPAATSGQTATTPPTEPVLGPFEFATEDGLTLEASRFGTGSQFVILAHMRPADMSSWFAFAGLLASEGYSAITFNFRGYGNSDGAGFAVDVDVAAAVDAAITLGAAEVFLIGASMGGSGSVVAASRRDVAGVVTMSAPAEFLGADAVDAASAVTAPMLLISAADDAPYAADAERIRASAAGSAEVTILSGRRHGTDLFQQHSEDLTALILDFLASA